jgi:hypothetical protein
MKNDPYALKVSLDAALREFSADLGVDLSFDHEHLCIFRYQSTLDVMVQLFPEAGRVTFAAVLKNEVDPGLQGLFPLLSYLNWMGVHTDGGAVCLNDETRSIIFWRDPLCLHWDGASLKAQLEDFIGVVIDVRAKVDEGLDALPQALFLSPEPRDAAPAPGQFA